MANRIIKRPAIKIGKMKSMVIKKAVRKATAKRKVKNRG